MKQADMPMPGSGLSADALIETLRRRFLDVPDHRRQASCDYSISDTLISVFATFATNVPSIAELLQVAFQRWRVERCFEDQKQEVGLDCYESRRTLLEQVASRVSYNQSRNAAARLSHTRTKPEEYARLGINPDTIKRCRWPRT